MKPLLFQIGLMFGGAVSTLSLLINLARRVDLLTSVFRAGIVFGVSLLVSVFFLQFFAIVLHRFVTEEMVKRNAAVKSEQEETNPEEAGAISGKGGSASPRLDVPRPGLPPRNE